MSASKRLRRPGAAIDHIDGARMWICDPAFADAVSPIPRELDRAIVVLNFFDELKRLAPPNH